MKLRVLGESLQATVAEGNIHRELDSMERAWA